MFFRDLVVNCGALRSSQIHKAKENYTVHLKFLTKISTDD